MAKIDNLGRIVIPKEYRQKLNLKSGDPVDISIANDTVNIKAQKTLCCVCGKTLDANCTVPLCRGCIDFVIKCRDALENGN